MKRPLIVSILTVAVFLSGGFAFADDREQSREKEQKQERIYGSQLMTDQERTEYRKKMRAAESSEAREQIRKEHHERMKARAKERGENIPDEPPARGSRMDSEGGRGSGKGGMRQGGGGGSRGY